MLAAVVIVALVVLVIVASVLTGGDSGEQPLPDVDRDTAVAALEYLRTDGTAMREFSSYVRGVISRARKSDSPVECRYAMSEEIPKRFNRVEVLKSAGANPDDWLGSTHLTLEATQEAAILACSREEIPTFEEEANEATRLEALTEQRVEQLKEVARR